MEEKKSIFSSVFKTNLQEGNISSGNINELNELKQKVENIEKSLSKINELEKFFSKIDNLNKSLEKLEVLDKLENRIQKIEDSFQEITNIKNSFESVLKNVLQENKKINESIQAITKEFTQNNINLLKNKIDNIEKEIHEALLGIKGNPEFENLNLLLKEETQNFLSQIAKLNTEIEKLNNSLISQTEYIKAFFEKSENNRNLSQIIDDISAIKECILSLSKTIGKMSQENVTNSEAIKDTINKKFDEFEENLSANIQKEFQENKAYIDKKIRETITHTENVLNVQISELNGNMQEINKNLVLTQSFNQELKNEVNAFKENFNNDIKKFFEENKAYIEKKIGEVVTNFEKNLSDLNKSLMRIETFNEWIKKEFAEFRQNLNTNIQKNLEENKLYVEKKIMELFSKVEDNLNSQIFSLNGKIQEINKALVEIKTFNHILKKNISEFKEDFNSKISKEFEEQQANIEKKIFEIITQGVNNLNTQISNLNGNMQEISKNLLEMEVFNQSLKKEVEDSKKIIVENINQTVEKNKLNLDLLSNKMDILLNSINDTSKAIKEETKILFSDMREDIKQTELKMEEIITTLFNEKINDSIKNLEIEVEKLNKINERILSHLEVEKLKTETVSQMEDIYKNSLAVKNILERVILDFKHIDGVTGWVLNKNYSNLNTSYQQLLSYLDRLEESKMKIYGLLEKINLENEKIEKKEEK